MTQSYTWELDVQEGWEVIPSFVTGESTPKFVSSEQSAERILVRYFWDPARARAYGHLRLGQQAQGPPGHAHGGCIAAVLDELMGLSAWRSNLAVVARELTIRYRRPTPLWKELQIEAWIESVDGRNATIVGRVHDGEGTVFAESSGVFTDIGGARFHDLADGARAVRPSKGG